MTNDSYNILVASGIIALCWLAPVLTIVIAFFLRKIFPKLSKKFDSKN